MGSGSTTERKEGENVVPNNSEDGAPHHYNNTTIVVVVAISILLITIIILCFLTPVNVIRNKQGKTHFLIIKRYFWQWIKNFKNTHLTVQQ